MKIKKMLSSSLCFVLICSLSLSFSVSAFLDEETKVYTNQWGDNSVYEISFDMAEDKLVYKHGDFLYFYYTYNNTYSMHIAGYEGTDTTVCIPNEIHGWPVEGIYDISTEVKIEELIIPENVMYLEAHSLSNMYMKKVTFAENSKLQFIGEYAFLATRGLEEISLPKSLENIGSYAFSSCESLKEIVIPEKCTKFGPGVFARCTSLERISFLGNEIHEYADDYEYFLRNDNKIPRFFAKDCTSLKYFDIPESVESIGQNAFENTGIETILIPEKCVNFSENVFAFCKSLKEIKLASNNINYCNYYIDGGIKDIKENTIPSSFATDCTSLKSIKLPETTKSIGEGAFQNSGLTSITIPKNVKTVYKNAFKGCENLTSVKFAGAVNNIGRSAFSKCANLKTVNFTKGYLKKVYDYAFYKCEKLDKITISNTKNVPTIAKSAFNKAKSGIKFYVKNNTVAKKLKAKLQKTNIKKAKIYRSAPILIYKNVG